MQQNLSRRMAPYADRLIGLALFLVSLAVYLRTLAPSVAELFDDSLEFQLIASRMAIAHPTGYPLFSILLKLFTLLPFGDVAYRANLGTALFAALAVAAFYAAARRLVASRLAAAIAALTLAFGPVFWSQAILAEVYSLQALLTAVMLYLALRWRKAAGIQNSKFKIQNSAIRITNYELRISILAFFFGLMLTHHRLSLLLAPALAVYVLTYDRQFLRQRRTLAFMAVAFVIPLLLYLYLPLRGMFTSSLDGTYRNTVAGFFGWVTGSAYNVFLTANPFNEQRPPGFYLDLFLGQFTWPGLALAVLGLLALFRRAWREGLLLLLALAVNLAFAVNYRVADVEVFFIPAILLTALLVAVGIDAVAQYLKRTLTGAGEMLERRSLPRILEYIKRLLAYSYVLLFLLPFWLLVANYQAEDLSGKWDVRDYGRDLVSQPLPDHSTLIGIGGEMSVVEYFQETQGLRPAVQTVRADREPARFAAIAAALAENRAVFLTRPLPGAPQKYSLASFGPLIEVQATPNTHTAPAPQHGLNEDFGGVRLIGYDLDTSRLSDGPNWHLENGRKLRVTLYWRVERRIQEDRLVSLKLLNSSGERAAQLDLHPVLDAYPTMAWRPGEYIRDTYDLPVLMGAAPGVYTLQATLYDPQSGTVYGQKDLEEIALTPDTRAHPRQLLDVEYRTARNFGGLALVGYSLNTADNYQAGDNIPITLLWRVQDDRPHALGLTVVDNQYRPLGALPLNLQATPGTGGQYLREEINLPVPSGASGPLRIELDRRPRDQLKCDLPLFTSCVTLGIVRVAK